MVSLSDSSTPPPQTDVPAGPAAGALTLLDWKRRVFGLYEEVRALDPVDGWNRWQATRDELFGSHPQSPLPVDARADFTGLNYFPYDPDWRVLVSLEDLPASALTIAASGGQSIEFERLARASFTVRGAPLELDVYWLGAYGGGIFVPFADATSGNGTYGGGRYVLDTVKGADLGTVDDELVLDFNFAYNPSCSYDPRWVCPLAPEANRLTLAVEAGERG